MIESEVETYNSSNNQQLQEQITELSLPQLVELRVKKHRYTQNFMSFSAVSRTRWILGENRSGHRSNS